jgi:hypothetical protein
MIERLFDKPPNAAISWVKRFLFEAWSKSEIENFVAFCEGEYRNAADVLAEQGASDGSWEYMKINQILYHVKDQAWDRSQQLLRIDSIESKVRERLSQ